MLFKVKSNYLEQPKNLDTCEVFHPSVQGVQGIFQLLIIFQDDFHNKSLKNNYIENRP